jgi:hypothetical protein
MMAFRTSLTAGRLLRSVVVGSSSPVLRSINGFSTYKITNKQFTSGQCQILSGRSFFGGPLVSGINLRSYSSTPSLADEVMKNRVGSPEKEKADEGQNKSSSEEEPKKGPKPLTKWQKIGYAAFGIFFTGGIIINAIVFCEFFLCLILVTMFFNNLIGSSK